MSSGLYKAVCYRCSYQGPISANRCPVCQFPMILEPEGTPPGRRLESIFDRHSVADGAPPLPGVHAEKRKAQLMAEARRERIATQRHARQSRDETRDESRDESRPESERERESPNDVSDVSDLSELAPESVRIPRFRHGALKLTLFCASAVAAGALAAALQSGAL